MLLSKSLITKTISKKQGAIRTDINDEKKISLRFSMKLKPHTLLTATWNAFFIVTVKPESVRIVGNDGVPMGNATMLGPLDEGTHVELICEANGGRPVPKVSWYNGTKEMKGNIFKSNFMSFCCS